MAVLDLISLALTPYHASFLFGLVLFVYYLYPYFITNSHLRDIPSPFPAAFSNLWLLWTARRGKRYLLVDEAHKRLGPVVRIQPNHVSIADDEAINAIYGHGNGFLKSDFYKPFMSIHPALFSTRDRAVHARKRKLVSHTFSPRSVSQFEPYIRQNLKLFVQKWDELVRTSAGNPSPTSPETDGAPEAHIDCLSWFNYLAFDVIGDLAFGAPFGMLSAGADIAEVRASPESRPVYASAVRILNRRGEVSATLGCLPQLKPVARWLPDPFFRQGLSAVQSLAGISHARVKARLEQPPSSSACRKDLLARLIEARDDMGEPLGREELTAEAQTQLIAGSDTTSNSSCALLYHATRTPGVLQKLQAELDAAIPSEAGRNDADDDAVPQFEAIRDLPYLQATINETLRIHSTSGIGLPREVPSDSLGVAIRGRHYPPGTVLSVPTYTMHHSKEIWGPDADEFRPERWLAEGGPTARQKTAFIPFSYGPRSCVGRNVAEIEMKLIAATWARRYDVVLRQGEMETREGFLRKPLGLEIGLKRRK